MLMSHSHLPSVNFYEMQNMPHDVQHNKIQLFNVANTANANMFLPWFRNHFSNSLHLLPVQFHYIVEKLKKKSTNYSHCAS